MLDRLLGREELKRELEELRGRLTDAEAGLEAAGSRLEKAEERRRRAVSERQDAQHRANVLRQRVQNLEAELESLRGQSEEETPSFTRAVSVGQYGLLRRLSSYCSDDDDLVTLLSPDLSGEDVLNDLEGDLSSVGNLDSRGILFHDQSGVLSVVAVPPVLVEEPFVRYGDRFETSPLDLSGPRGDQVFCFARSDEASIARIEGGSVSSFRRLEADVMSTHAKGGFSQRRFERRRREQVDRHVSDTVSELEDVVEPGVFVAICGDADVARRLAEEMDFPASNHAVRPLDMRDVEEASELLRAEERFWEVRVYVV